MRLPLGILTGIGFIGAGAILRRGDMVLGATTAATIWFVAVLGICFGGGQIWLGLAALSGALIRRDRLASLTVAISAKGPVAE